MKKIFALFAMIFALTAIGGRAQAQCTGGGTNCYLVFALADTYGDGWNGNTLTVTQNNTTLATLTISDGFSQVDTVRICTEDGPVQITYNPTGSWQSENSFTVTDSLGSALCSGQGDATGSSYTVAPCPTCPSPSNLAASNLTSSSATVAWTEMGSATTWYYTYGTYSTPTGAWQMATADSVELTGLQANTVYHFFVYSDCGGGDTSVFSTFTFRTACGLMSLPIVEDFESGETIPSCWNRFETVNYDYYGTFPTVMSYYGMNQGNGLLLAGNNGDYYSPTPHATSVMSPKMPVAANAVEVVMWVKGEEAVQVGYVTTNDTNAAVFHLVGTAGPTTYDEDNYDYVWEQFTVSFDTVTTTDSIWVVFRCAPSLANYPMYVDNITIRQLINCPLPTGLAEVPASTPVSGQVTLTWTDAVGTQWQIARGAQGFDPDTASTFVAASSTTTTVTGLADSMMYDFYVRTVCGNEHGYWVGPVSALPNTYQLDTLHAVDTIISCGINVVSDGGFNASCTPGFSQTVVLMPTGTDNTVRIRGYAHLNSYYSSYYPNKMRIFAGADTNGTLLANINSTDVNNIDITSEVGAITIWYSIADESYYAAEGFKFYVSCEELPDCTTPYGFATTDVGGNYADVVWSYDNSMGEAAGFTLIVTDLSDSSTMSITLGGTERSYIIGGLNERTDYSVQLALDCPGIDTLEITFSTGCIVGGDLRVGTGTSTTSYIPAYLYYNYSLSQQIFTANELEGVDSIYGFKFYMTSSNTTPNRTWDVYLDSTALSHYSSTSDYQPTNDSSRYFHGTVSFAQGWNEVVFDSVFAVPAGKNITLTINDITGSYESGRSFRKTNTTDTMSLYGYTDYAIYNPAQASLSYAGKFRTTIIFTSSCFSTDCVPPTHVVATPDTHSATLTWMAGADETTWKVEYRVADSTTWQLADAAVSTTSYTVTGLMAATEYVFRVSTVCADTALGRTAVATTLCGEYGLPFVENFEWFTATTADPTTEMCWYRATNYSWDYYYPYCLNNASSAHGGTWSMYFMSYRDRLVLPKMAPAVNTLSLDFYAMYDVLEYYYVPALEIGVAVNPADTNTYTVVQTITPGADAYELFTVDFDSYNGADGYIFIRSLAGGNYSPVYVDDITVMPLPACRALTAVNVNNVTPNSAELAIVDGYNRTSYTVLWGTAASIQGATDSMTVSNSTLVTLTGLAPATTYHAWVRANCGGTDGQSRYKAVRPFTTICSAIAVTEDTPWFTEFEADSMPCIWQTSDVPNLEWKVATTGGDYNNTVHAYSGGHMLNLGGNQTAEVKLVLPTFDFTGMTGNAEVSLYHYMLASHTAYSNYNAPTLSIYYRAGVSGPWTLAATIDTTVTNSWKKRYVELPASQGAANYQVAIVGNPNGNSYGVYLDNVEVKGVTTCLPPTGVAVRDVTDRTATVAWTGTAQAYKVQYRPVGQWSWNARTVENNDTVVLIPLEMLTEYEVRVASLCGDFEQSEYSDVVRFITDICGDRMEKLNHVSTDVDTVSTMAPFNAAKNYVYDEIIVDSARLAGMTDINGFAFYVDNIIGTTDLNNCQVYMAHTSASTLTAFLYDTTFTQVFDGTFNLHTGWNTLVLDTPFQWNGSDNLVVGVRSASTEYSDTVIFGAHQATGNKVFCGSNNTSFSLTNANMLSAANKVATSVVPDLKFYSCNPVCNEPVLSRVSATATTIDVEWYNEGATIELQFKESAASTWGSSVIISNAHSFRLEDMASITSFDIRLRRVCDEVAMFYSDWVECTAVTDTMCSIPTNLTVSSVDAHSATFSWTDGAVAGSMWLLHVWNDEVDFLQDVTTNPATLGGLPSGGTYHAAVSAYCGSGNHVPGEFSQEIVFNNICQPVSNLNATIVNGSDVNLTWTAGERNTKWYVCWGFAGFDINQQLGYMVVTSPSATITGLGAVTAPYSGTKDAEGTTYAFLVRAICADDWNSAWSSATTARFVGIDEVQGEEMKFVLQPNPASDRVALRISDFEGCARVDVLSIDGRQMFEFDVQSSRLDFDVSALAAGTYFVRVQTDSWTSVRKLVVR